MKIDVRNERLAYLLFSLTSKFKHLTSSLASIPKDSLKKEGKPRMQDPNNQNTKPLYPPNDPPAAPIGNQPLQTQAIQENPIPAQNTPTPPVHDIATPTPTVQPSEPYEESSNTRTVVEEYISPASTPQTQSVPMYAPPVAPPSTILTTTPPPLSPSPIPPPTLPPTSVLTPTTPHIAAPPLSQAIPASAVAASFAPKSKFPKIALIASLSLLIIVIIIFGVFQFMSGGTEPTVGTKGEITWWGVQLDETTVAPLISEYESTHPNIKITYTQQSQTDYRERLTNALASGNGPDIFEVHNSWPAMFKNELTALPASVMSPDEYKGTFYPVIASDLTLQKGIVGLPLYYDALTLYVNDDLFATALKNPPKTWIDVQVLADPINGLTQKDAEGRILQSAIALGTTENVAYWPDILGLMLYQNKADFINLELPATKDVLSFYQYFGTTTGNWDATLPLSTEAFAKQKTAMIVAPASAAYAIIQSNPTLHFKTYTLPQLPKETPTDPDVSYATYWAESVWEKSASKEDAWEFLKFMTSSESLQKINQILKSNSKTQRAYPIPNLNQQFANDPILGSVVALARSAKSWYLADYTNDGATGINTLLRKAYEKALSADSQGAQAEITKILTQYGITATK